MKLNEKQINISSHVKETLNNEMMFYNEENKKVIVLNSTATNIWKIIEESYQNDIDIYTKDILAELVKIYNINETGTNAITIDIEETIQLLYESSLLKII